MRRRKPKNKRIRTQKSNRNVVDDSSNNTTAISQFTFINIYLNHKKKSICGGLLFILGAIGYVNGNFNDFYSNFIDSSNKEVITEVVTSKNEILDSNKEDSFKIDTILKVVIGENPEQLFGEENGKLLLAKGFIEDDRFDEAIAKLKELLEIKPDSYEANFLLGLLYYNNNEMDKSLPYFKQSHLNFKYKSLNNFKKEFIKLTSLFGFWSVNRNGKELLEEESNPLAYLIYAWCYTYGIMSGEMFFNNYINSIEPYIVFLKKNDTELIIVKIIVFQPTISVLIYDKEYDHLPFNEFLKNDIFDTNKYKKPDLIGTFNLKFSYNGNTMYSSLPITYFSDKQIFPEHYFTAKELISQKDIPLKLNLGGDHFSMPLLDGVFPKPNEFYKDKNLYDLITTSLKEQKYENVLTIIEISGLDKIDYYSRHYSSGLIYRLIGNLRKSSIHFMNAFNNNQGSYRYASEKYLYSQSWLDYESGLNNYWPLYQIVINYYIDNELKSIEKLQSDNQIILWSEGKNNVDPNIRIDFEKKKLKNNDPMPAVIQQVTFETNTGFRIILPDELDKISDWMLEGK